MLAHRCGRQLPELPKQQGFLTHFYQLSSFTPALQAVDSKQKKNSRNILQATLISISARWETDQAHSEQGQVDLSPDYTDLQEWDAHSNCSALFYHLCIVSAITSNLCRHWSRVTQTLFQFLFNFFLPHYCHNRHKSTKVTASEEHGFSSVSTAW